MKRAANADASAMSWPDFFDSLGRSRPDLFHSLGRSSSKGKGKATPWAGMAEASDWALPCEDQSWCPQDDLTDSDLEDNKMLTGEDPPAIVTAICKGTSNLPTPSSAGSNAVNAKASRLASSSRPPPKKSAKISEGASPWNSGASQPIGKEGPPRNPEEGEDEEFDRLNVRFRRLNALQQKLQQGAVAGQKMSQQKKEMLGELRQKKEKIAEEKKEIGEHGEQLHQQMKQLHCREKKLEMDEGDVDFFVDFLSSLKLASEEGNEEKSVVHPEQLNFADTDRFTEIIPGQVYYDRLMHSFLEKEKGKGVFRYFGGTKAKVAEKGDKGKGTGKTLEERWKWAWEKTLEDIGTEISEDWVHEKVYQPNCMRCDEWGVGHGHESPCQACGAILRSTTLEEARDWEKALELRANWAEGGKVQDGRK